jgi:CubicO group peptidase (beta-lactamase class C family)
MKNPFERVEQLFREQQAHGAFPGGQLVVRRRGQVLCDLAVGLACVERAGQREIEVTPETRFQIMSASKPFAGLAIALLEEGGQLDVHLPVARYFPEFAQGGKADVTVLDVLTHRSGLVFEELGKHAEWWRDWDRVVRALAEARPKYRRGTLAYSPGGFGWVLAEIVRRISGQTLQDFLLSRLPAELSGVRFLDPSQRDRVARSYWLGPKKLMLAGHDIAADFEQLNNGYTAIEACVPGAGMLATARELSAFYQLLVDGGRDVIGKRTLERYVTPQTFGFERELKIPLRLGRGFGLGSLGPSPYGWWNTRPCFGHAGGFGVLGFADPRSGVAAAIVTNGHRGVGDLIRRFAPLGSAIRRAARDHTR